jgi:voltage-gated potassium channel
LITPGSTYDGLTLVESQIRRDLGVIMVAIKKASGTMVFNPLPTEKLVGGDVAVVIGKREELERLRHKLE